MNIRSGMGAMSAVIMAGLLAGCSAGGEITPQASSSPAPASARPSATTPAANSGLGGTTKPATTSRPVTGPRCTGPAANTRPPTTSEPKWFRTSYGWRSPMTRTEIKPVHAGVDTNQTVLTGVYVGDHPQDNPSYSRISFYFEGGFPDYNFQYERAVHTEGQGDKLPLTGNTFLRLQFSNAVAHTLDGKPTVSTARNHCINYPTLRSYGFGGDFEGYVTIGLGIQATPNSDHILPIRVSEFHKLDAKNRDIYVIAVDVSRV